MADIGMRDLGSFVPGGRRADPRDQTISADRDVPKLQTPPESVAIAMPPPARAQQIVFSGDRPDGRDALGIDDTLAIIAELTAHKGTASPLCIGLIGGPGSGKSFALGRLAARIGDLAAAAARLDTSPFLSRIHVTRIDAASIDGDPMLAIAARLHADLRAPYPSLARDLGASARDPGIVLRESEEKLDDARRRLDSERRALDDAGSRRARLTETVLYESAGSAVDAYARANRPSIESRLTSFGVYGDATRTYKDLVRLAASPSGKLGLMLRSLWGYKGQTKLIVAAIVLVALGIGIGIAIDDQARWLGDLRGGPKTGASVADWFQAHMTLLSTARSGAFALAVAALAVNGLRALAFLRPILKGATLLDKDLDARRRDLDSLYAHQTKRVDALESEAERLTRTVAEAERRAGTTGDARHEPSPFSDDGLAPASGFFTALSGAMAETSTVAPHRVVLALDHLDALPPERTRAILDALHRTAGTGIVTLAVFDPARIDPDGARHGDLERWIQVPVRVDGAAAANGVEELVRQSFGQSRAAAVPAALDVRRSDLDAEFDDTEASLLTELTGLAGRSPRAIKRFANLYRLARTGDERPLAILAFMLALAQGGTDAERAAVASALANEGADRFDLSATGGRVSDALAAVIAVGGRVSKADARDAAHRAALFSWASADAR